MLAFVASALLFLLADSKLIRNHIDWKESNGETMLYAIKFVTSSVTEPKHDLANYGLQLTSTCLYIPNCHVFTHAYHFANGSCAFSNTTCATTVKANKDYLHSKLENIKDIEWFVEIWERQRHKRGHLQFEDPQYNAQWHLVRRAAESGEIHKSSLMACCSILLQ